MDAVGHEDLSDAYLLCRTLGHAWYEQSASDLESAGRGFWWLVVSCERCSARRVDLVGLKSGSVEKRRYEYPDGYEINETTTRSQLRVEWERRRNEHRRLTVRRTKAS